MEVFFKRLDSWPRARTIDKTRSQFRVTFENSLELLKAELEWLSSKQVVIQLDIHPSDLRNDGWPRSAARVGDPGVLVSFVSKHGPLEFACDKFLHWHENLRAVAMTLNRLRLADLYGVTQRGEQYKGWEALMPPVSTSPFATIEAAANWLFEQTKCGSVNGIVFSKDNRATAYRAAAKKLHPDVGGTTEQFQLLEEAKKMLDTVAPVL